MVSMVCYGAIIDADSYSSDDGNASRGGNDNHSFVSSANIVGKDDSNGEGE